jgi:signal peptidase II
MSKRHWIIYVAIPLLVTWGLDRISKIYSVEIVGKKIFGGLYFVVHHNHGAMLGLFSDLPALLRIVSLSTGGAFLIFVFVILQYLLPDKMLPLRSGMSILLGGILGNVTDRIAWGYVVDFVTIRAFGFVSPAFNIADALQWVGYALIVYTLIKEGDKLWPENNLRKSYWINPKFQIQYVSKLIMFGLGFAIISGTYSYAFLKVTIVDLMGRQPHIQDRFLIPFLVTFAIVSLTFIIILFFVGLVLSHRSAGPIYAFERYLKDIMNGVGRPLKLRTGDEFTQLEKMAQNLTEHLTKKGTLTPASEPTESDSDKNA